MARSPLTETIARVQGMISYVRENLNPGEYDLFLDLIDPQPEPAKVKRTRAPRTGLPQQAHAPAPQQGATDKEAKCRICSNVKDHPDHDRSYIKSHDFEPPKSVVRAPRKSKQKPEAALSIPSSETGSEGAGVAALAASGGD